MKRFLTALSAFIIFLLMPLALSACSPWTEVQRPSGAAASVIGGEKLKDESCVRWIGRTEYGADGNMYCYYTATGFTVKFTGTELKVTFGATNTSSDKNRPYFEAEVDDGSDCESRSFALTEAVQTVTVAENLTYGTYTVTVLKRSEPENSLTSVNEIQTDGAFKTPARHTGLNFQILGGSGISGHGCLGQPDEGWTTKNSSSLKGFGYLAAKAFGAETQFVSNSGMGLVWGYRGVASLASAYDATGLVAEYNADGSTKSVGVTGEWNHTSWTPDVVIVNIGGNDWNSHISLLTGAARTAAETQFKDAVAQLLTKIHTLYPEACVVWTCNSIKSGNGALANQSVADLDFKNKVRLLEIDNSKDGADNHAGEATQAANAKTVADAITAFFGFSQI